jgi:hypothetical protein
MFMNQHSSNVAATNVRLVFWLLAICLSLESTNFAQDSICVRVKIEIDQELTLERQGFEARMNIKNGGAVDLENLNVVLNFLDENNSPVVATSDPNSTTAKFFVRLTSSATLPNRVAGTGEEKLRWLIVPAPSSAGSDPTGTLYFVGAKLTYTSSGVESVIDVTPDSIRVSPMPLLTLDYFLPYDVYGDNPFTTQIEPPIPFNLGVRVKNSGFGTAKQVKIESSQPRIVENLQGLLINFKIEGSEVNGQTATPSLLADFGDIASNRSGVGRWIMTTSLYGRFVEFSATFTHALISEIHTHRLVHDVMVDLQGRDVVRDFLASDDGVLKVYESENNDATVVDLSAQAGINSAGQAFRVTVPASVGFSYVKLTDPFAGAKVLTSVLRSDGKPINVNNAWLSSTYLPDVQQWNYFLNIFDTNNVNGAFYDVVFGAPGGGNRAPVLQQPADRITRVGNFVGFLVQATDPDGDTVTVSATALPVGASLAINAQGTWVFSWTPGATQTGNFPIQFVASDGRLMDRKTVVITVTAGSLFHDWKNRYWPGVTDQTIIGNNVDGDGDELTNLVEYALGLDPTTGSPDGAPEIGIVEVGGMKYLSLTYVGRTDDPNLQFAVLAADSTKTANENWQVLTETMPADQTGVQSGFQKVIVRDSFPIDGTRQKRFLKLRVTTTEAD